MKKFFILLAPAIIVSVVVGVSMLIYIQSKAVQDTKAKSDAILVLGGSAIGGLDCFGPICQQGFVPQAHLNPCLVARVNHAVMLYKAGLAPKILMSGGTDKETNVNEAEIMKNIAVQAGIPETAIFWKRHLIPLMKTFLFPRNCSTN